MAQNLKFTFSCSDTEILTSVGILTYVVIAPKLYPPFIVKFKLGAEKIVFKLDRNQEGIRI